MESGGPSGRAHHQRRFDAALEPVRAGYTDLIALRDKLDRLGSLWLELRPDPPGVLTQPSAAIHLHRVVSL